MTRKDFEALAYALGTTGADARTIKAVGDCAEASEQGALATRLRRAR